MASFCDKVNVKRCHLSLNDKNFFRAQVHEINYFKSAWLGNYGNIYRYHYDFYNHSGLKLIKHSGYEQYSGMKRWKELKGEKSKTEVELMEI